MFALGCVVANSLQAQSFVSITELVDSVSEERISQHIRFLQEASGHQSRVTFTPGNDSGAAYIERQMRSIGGLTTVELDTFTISGQPPYNTQPVVNVIGTLEGLSRPSEVLILGAHYDCSASRMGTTVWNSEWNTLKARGADDNASGVAAVLEVERLLADPATGFAKDMTIKFIAFGSEESGPAHDGSHNGSTHYASQAKSRGENIVGMLSIDMIGYNWAHNYTAIVSDQASSWLGDAFRSAVAAGGVPLETNPPPYPYAVYSDHEAFWTQGYPAILLIENAPPWNSSSVYAANPYYHTTSDTLETVNTALVRRVAQAVLAMSVAFGGGLTSIPGESHPLPLSLELFPNYPNPFNPSTVISFGIPTEGEVLVRVFDALGREVKILANGYYHSGMHTLQFDGSDLPSGLYLVSLEYGSETKTMKTLLVR